MSEKNEEIKTNIYENDYHLDHHPYKCKCLLDEEAQVVGVYDLAKFVLEDEEFLKCSGSGYEGHHHYGHYGLLTHTAEVVLSCMKMKDFYKKNIDGKVLFLAALFHDSGKTKDYKEIVYYCSSSIERPIWEVTDHKHKIHHITGSVLIWNKALDEYEKKNRSKKKSLEYLREQVTHCILSHHGRKEWRSPVPPQSAEAWILHTMDTLSARYDDYKTNERED